MVISNGGFDYQSNSRVIRDTFWKGGILIQKGHPPFFTSPLRPQNFSFNRQKFIHASIIAWPPCPSPLSAGNPLWMLPNVFSIDCSARRTAKWYFFVMLNMVLIYWAKQCLQFQERDYLKILAVVKQVTMFPNVSDDSMGRFNDR